MSIEFNCESCGKHFKVADDAAGKRAKCKGCGAIIQVPYPEDGPPDLSAIEAAASDESAAPTLEVTPPRIAAADTATHCPSCRAPLARGAVLCMACGFDTRRGTKLAGIASGATRGKKASGEREIKWWIMILGGLALIPMAISEYNDLGRWEAEGGTRLMNTLTSVVYHTVGRTGVLVVGLLASASLIAWGIYIRASAWKKPVEAAPSSLLKDVIDAAIVLKGPLAKLILLGLFLANFLFAAAVLSGCGYGREDMEHWSLTLVFGSMALALAEFSILGMLIRKFDEEHKPDTRLLAGGIIVSLLLTLGFGYQANSARQAAIEQQRKTDENQAELRRISESFKAIKPAMDHLRELQAAEAVQSASAAANATTQPIVPKDSNAFTHTRPIPSTQPEPALPDEPGPAWAPGADQIALLGKEVAIGAYSIRPPLGLRLQAPLAKGLYRWASIRGMFSVNISDRTNAGFHPPIMTVPNRVPSAPFGQVFIGATKEIGTIGGIPFVRAFKEGIGKRIYAGYDADRLIVITFTVKDMADLPACDAAAKTFHKTP